MTLEPSLLDRLHVSKIRELEAALESSEARRDAACRGNVRLAAELEKANKRIAELEAKTIERAACNAIGD